MTTQLPGLASGCMLMTVIEAKWWGCRVEDDAGERFHRVRKNENQRNWTKFQWTQRSPLYLYTLLHYSHLNLKQKWELLLCLFSIEHPWRICHWWGKCTTTKFRYGSKKFQYLKASNKEQTILSSIIIIQS